MASKADVEKLATLIWNRVARASLEREYPKFGFLQAWKLFKDRPQHDQNVWRAVARWHLRKLEEAYSRGHEQGRADEWCDNA